MNKWRVNGAFMLSISQILCKTFKNTHMLTLGLLMMAATMTFTSLMNPKLSYIYIGDAENQSMGVIH